MNTNSPRSRLILTKIFSIFLLPFLCLAPTLADGVLADEIDEEVMGLNEVRSLVSQSKWEAALTLAIKELEYTPSNPELLALASQCCESLGKKDNSLWYATLSIDAYRNAPSESDKPAKTKADLPETKALQEKIAKIDPLHEEANGLLDAYAATLLDLSKTCKSKGYYVNAVDLLSLCKGTGLTLEAQKELEKIFRKKGAEQSLIASGMDISIPKKKNSSKRLAAHDRKHRNWDNAEKVKKPNYTVVTNMGSELAHSVANAMEQMNLFYRKVFDHKTRGGGTARLTLHIYNDRKEFDQHEGDNPPSVRGFFSPRENKVATYNPASDGRSGSALWSTLFHEASHQFTEMISPGNIIPGWLNEGTASYFEGARLLPSGFVQTNLIPEGRLRNLRAILDRGEPSIKTVLSFLERGSYPGSYYPVGWGLVYFIHNYENDASERVFLRPYQKFIKSYKSGGKHDTFKRFEEIFIKKARISEIKSFEQFEETFKKWIYELHDLYFGPAEKATLLVKKARKQRDHKKYEAALETYQWALQKRPDDLVAAFERAEVLNLLKKRKDESLFSYRRAIGSARAITTPDRPLDLRPDLTANTLADRCIERIQKLDSSVALDTAAADAGFVAKVSEMAKKYQDLKLPRRAAHFVNVGNRMIGGHRDLIALKESVMKENQIETRRWKRLPFSADSEKWSGGDGWTQIDRDSITGKSDFPKITFFTEPFEGDFRYELNARPLGKFEGSSMLGCVFGANATSPEKILVFVSNGAFLAKLKTDEDGNPGGLEILGSWRGQVVKEDSNDVKIAVDVKGNKTRFFLNDEFLFDHDLPLDESEGLVGLIVQNSEVTFSDPRVLN